MITAVALITAIILTALAIRQNRRTAKEWKRAADLWAQAAHNWEEAAAAWQRVIDNRNNKAGPR